MNKNKKEKIIKEKYRENKKILKQQSKDNHLNNL